MKNGTILKIICFFLLCLTGFLFSGNSWLLPRCGVHQGLNFIGSGGGDGDPTPLPPNLFKNGEK